MLKRTGVFLLVFLAAGLVLAVSIFRSSLVRYSFRLAPMPTPTPFSRCSIDYSLPYPGIIGPANPLWVIKALRDRIWLAVNFNPLKKAEIMLLLSDKRLVLGNKLVSEGEGNLGVGVLEKSTMYLFEAYQLADKASSKGMDVADFVGRLSLASLKHREVLETILVQAPSDARPMINKDLGIVKDVYEKSGHMLRAIGREPAPNPFEASGN